MTERIPAPPEGMDTYPTGYPAREAGHIISRDRDRSGARMRVWAEGRWLPVVHVHGTWRRSVDLSYSGSKSPGSVTGTDGEYRQRVVPERIAIHPDLIPQYLGMEQRRQDDIARQAKLREERIALKAAEREQAERGRAAREAAAPPAEKLAKVRRDIAVGRELIAEREEEAARAVRRLADLRAHLAKLTELETLLIERIKTEETP